MAPLLLGVLIWMAMVTQVLNYVYLEKQSDILYKSTVLVVYPFGMECARMRQTVLTRKLLRKLCEHLSPLKSIIHERFSLFFLQISQLVHMGQTKQFSLGMKRHEFQTMFAKYCFNASQS